MDKHEKGIEVDGTRPDMPLPRWNGSYRGDPKRLPRVVQKLLHGRPLTPEEKAELLWRFYELDQSGRVRRRAVWTTILVVLVVGFTAYFAYSHWDSILGRVETWLSPPAK